MKERLSISIDKKLIEEFNNSLKKTGRKFSNRSHAFERAMELLIEEIKNDGE
ncbi:MAG: hypothetical protein PHU12_03635 [Candidatus Aenigmarchaeota archaeon]|nr:hypothetical protein [Candidatus Aenigmarchaeota archaeon]